MLRYILMLFSVIAILHNMNALALSDKDYRYFMKTSSAYADAEKQLNTIWSHLKENLPKDEFSRLLAEQRQWINTERDKKAAKFKGDRPDAEAYAIVTIARANELLNRYKNYPPIYTQTQPNETPPVIVSPPQSFYSGTGFFVSSDGFVVTNYHVVENMKDIKIYDHKDNNLTDATVMRVDKENDLALLRIRGATNKPQLPLATRFMMKRGEEVFVLGYPSPNIQGSQQKATVGRVNAITGLADDVRYFQMDSPVQPGNSGGPVFNGDGEVVGIVTSRLKGEFQNVNYALKIDYLIPLVVTAIPNVFDGMPSKPEPGLIPKLMERFEDSVVMIVSVR